MLLAMLRRYLKTVPYRSRPALYYESFYSVGRGAFLALWPLSWVVLKTVLDGELWHLTAVTCIWGVAGLLAPAWASLRRRVGVRPLVLWPNIIAGISLGGILLVDNATEFLLLVTLAYVIGAPTRLTEMSLYRIFYPSTHRSRAVAWLKGIAVTSGSLATLAGIWLVDRHGSRYAVLYAVVGVVMIVAAWFYGRIPIPRRVRSFMSEPLPLRRALTRAWMIFSRDRRFFRYQSAFFASGFGNLLSLGLVAEVMREELQSPAWAMGMVVAFFPILLQPLSAPLWGRLLDRISPMSARALFSFSMMLTYSLYCYGGLAMALWPFLLGSLVQGASQSGTQINWTTGSLYFAPSERVPLYNSLHVVLTGVRGLLAPPIGAWLFGPVGLGSWVFSISVALALVGMVGMMRLAAADPGPPIDDEGAGRRTVATA